MTQITYTVPAMTCEHCRGAVDRELRLVPGVRAVDINLDSKRVVVSGDDLEDADLRAAIEHAGYLAG